MKLSLDIFIVFLLIILILKITQEEINSDINLLNNSYNTKFSFNKLNFNYYNFITKLIINPRSSKNFLNILKKLNINNKDVILDIGSGDGYNLLYFNKFYNFKKIYGIEIDQNIYNISKNNINLIKNKKISLIKNDILKFEIPNNVNYIYLFNPFQKNYITNYFLNEKNHIKSYEILINNINKSLNLKDRKITIIFVNINSQIISLFKKHFKLKYNGKVHVNLFLNTNYAIFTSK